MYRSARSRFIVNGTFSDDFPVQLGFHQGSVLSSLLFIVMLEVLCREIRSGCQEELLYADDVALVSETLGGMKERLAAWKGVFGSKG